MRFQNLSEQIFLRVGLLSGFLALSLAGCGGSGTTGTTGNEGTDAANQLAENASTEPPVLNPRDIPEGQGPPLKALKIYSNPPGCLVFIGQEVVRTEEGMFAQTPVDVKLPAGRAVVSVERPGGRRVTQSAVIPQEEEIEIDASAPLETENPNEKFAIVSEPSYLNAPLFEASVGRIIPLTSVNSPGKDFDPFVSADGNTLWFVSDRNGLRGIYTASRPSPYHDFSEPKLIGASGGADLPASPSVTDDGLILIYAVPEKARLWQVTRTEPTAEFGNREVARTDETTDHAWRSCQVSGDGLRLYWSDEGGDAFASRAAVRATTEKLFGKTLKFDIPNAHPRLSSDALRHFMFDGTKLMRSRRGSIKQPFGPAEEIAEVVLENFTVSARHRQFWVTDDEQWMIYCDDPQSGGDLYLVRLSDGLGWGRKLIGKPIPTKVKPTDSDDDKPMVEKPVEPKVDPRLLPLAYTSHWKALLELLAIRQAEEATALIEKARADEALSRDRTLLDWDVDLVTKMSQFNAELARTMEALKPGASIKIGANRFEFEKCEGDVFHLKIKDKKYTKSLKDFSPSDLVALIDSGPEKASAEQSLLFGIFLHFQGESSEKVSRQWLKRGLDQGEVFLERLAARSLTQGQQEIARGKLSEGITFLDEAVLISPGSDAGKEAVKQKTSLFDKLEWKPVGPRKWERGELGEFAADTSRANGSFLVSEQKYGDFEVSCEWKVNGPTAMGGLYLRFDGRGNPFENRSKIHLANDLDRQRPDQYTTGSLFASEAPKLNAALPEGKWNTLRIQVRGHNIIVWINGKEVLKTTLEMDVPESGHVVLDGVAGGMSYRKVLIFELPKEK